MFSNIPAQNFQWVNYTGSTGSDYAKSVATDNAGNIYMTGYFSSPTIVFGSTTLTNTGSADIFLVKYDAAGNVIWATSASGSSYNYANSITADCGPGNIIITGVFGGSITFGSTTLTANSGGSDIFVVQYDSGGNVMWAKSAGGSNSDYAYSVTTDYGCNVYITGYFSSPTIAFGNLTLTNTTSGWNNVYLAKYDMYGDEVWVRGAGGSGNLTHRGNAVNYNNNGIYIAGHFSNSITFGINTLTSIGSDDLFLVNYDVNGNVIWAKRAGGNSDESGISIAVNSNASDIYLVGNFNSPQVIFGSTTLFNASPGPFYYNDVFIAKYDYQGDVVWAKRYGDVDDDRAGGITMDVFQNIYSTGVFEGSIVFGNDTLNSNGQNSDIYIAKQDFSGNELWLKQAGDTGIDYASGIAVNFTDTAAYICGYSNGPSFTIGSFSFTNAGSQDLYLAKIGDITTAQNFIDKPLFSSLYPNPTSGIVRFDNLLSDVTIRVYNLFGELILIDLPENADSIKELDLSPFPAGVYLVLMSSEKQHLTEKVIIRR